MLKYPGAAIHKLMGMAAAGRLNHNFCTLLRLETLIRVPLRANS